MISVLSDGLIWTRFGFHHWTCCSIKSRSHSENRSIMDSDGPNYLVYTQKALLILHCFRFINERQSSNDDSIHSICIAVNSIIGFCNHLFMKTEMRFHSHNVRNAFNICVLYFVFVGIDFIISNELVLKLENYFSVYSSVSIHRLMPWATYSYRTFV